MRHALQIYTDLRNIRPGSHDQTQPWRGHGTNGFGIKPKGKSTCGGFIFPMLSIEKSVDKIHDIA